MTEIMLTASDAKALEEKFLLGIGDAQSAYEQIVEQQAWTALGFESLADWWDARVRPVMTALSMKPTREIAAAVIEQVRAEEAELPPTWRRTQAQLAEMVGESQWAGYKREARSSTLDTSKTGDLAAPSPDEASTTDTIDDVPLWDDEPEPEAVHTVDTPAEQTPMPARQELADLLTSRLDEVVARRTAAPTPTTPDEARERDYQTSREAWSRNLAKCVYLLAGFSNLNGFVDKALAEWQPDQDIYPEKTTAERMRTAAAYLNSIAERWPS